MSCTRFAAVRAEDGQIDGFICWKMVSWKSKAEVLGQRDDGQDLCDLQSTITEDTAVELVVVVSQKLAALFMVTERKWKQAGFADWKTKNGNLWQTKRVAVSCRVWMCLCDEQLKTNCLPVWLFVHHQLSVACLTVASTDFWMWMHSAQMKWLPSVHLLVSLSRPVFVCVTLSVCDWAWRSLRQIQTA